VIPRQNAKNIRKIDGMRVYGVETLAEAVSILIG